MISTKEQRKNFEAKQIDGGFAAVLVLSLLQRHPPIRQVKRWLDILLEQIMELWLLHEGISTVTRLEVGGHEGREGARVALAVFHVQSLLVPRSGVLYNY